MNIEVINDKDKIILRITEKSGKYLDLIMDDFEIQDLVNRLMLAVSYQVEVA